MFQRSLKALAVPWVRVRSCRELRVRNKVRRNEVKQYLVRANLPPGLLLDKPGADASLPGRAGRMVAVQKEVSDGDVIRDRLENVVAIEFSHRARVGERRRVGEAAVERSRFDYKLCCELPSSATLCHGQNMMHEL